MHKPLVSEQDLEDAANDVVTDEDDGSVPVYDGTSGPINPNDLINNII